MSQRRALHHVALASFHSATSKGVDGIAPEAFVKDGDMQLFKVDKSTRTARQK